LHAGLTRELMWDKYFFKLSPVNQDIESKREAPTNLVPIMNKTKTKKIKIACMFFPYQTNSPIVLRSEIAEPEKYLDNPQV
jgi:hypothetical protein